jgi:hypothetical protein
MTPVLIACIILAVGAAAEITAYVFTDRLLKKREDGLDRRKAALDALEYCIKMPKEQTFATKRMNLKKYIAESSVGASGLRGTYGMPENMMACVADEARHKVCTDLFLHIPVRRIQNADDSLTFRAELWVVEGGPDGVS